MKKLILSSLLLVLFVPGAIAHEVVRVSCQCNVSDTLAFGHIINASGKTEKEAIYKANSECEKVSDFESMLQYCRYVIDGNYINTFIDLCDYDFQTCGISLIDG